VFVVLSASAIVKTAIEQLERMADAEAALENRGADRGSHPQTGRWWCASILRPTPCRALVPLMLKRLPARVAEWAGKVRAFNLQLTPAAPLRNTAPLYADGTRPVRGEEPASITGMGNSWATPTFART